MWEKKNMFYSILVAYFFFERDKKENSLKQRFWI